MLLPSFHKGAATHTFLPALRVLGEMRATLTCLLTTMVRGLVLSQFTVEEMEAHRGQGYTVSGSRFKARQGVEGPSFRHMVLPPRLVEEGLHAIVCVRVLPRPAGIASPLPTWLLRCPSPPGLNPPPFRPSCLPLPPSFPPPPLQPTHTFHLLPRPPHTQALPTLRAKLFRLTLQPQLHRGTLGLGSVSDFIYAPGVQEDSERER